MRWGSVRWVGKCEVSEVGRWEVEKGRGEGRWVPCGGGGRRLVNTRFCTVVVLCAAMTQRFGNWKQVHLFCYNYHNLIAI